MMQIWSQFKGIAKYRNLKWSDRQSRRASEKNREAKIQFRLHSLENDKKAQSVCQPKKNGGNSGICNGEPGSSELAAWMRSACSLQAVASKLTSDTKGLKGYLS